MEKLIHEAKIRIADSGRGYKFARITLKNDNTATIYGVDSGLDCGEYIFNDAVIKLIKRDPLTFRLISYKDVTMPQDNIDWSEFFDDDEEDNE